ncbi:MULTISPECIES: patatin-like phospholipase family protein [Paracoccus]|uniref:patatin-like phospholipase family protein n=1 Tax=Paracoccus TaxID=265 RepID=UPI001FB6BD6D|nr:MULTISPECIES: patatin-like phospholipase family protein [Paracoccus]MCJ1899542.1 patatin-like phospholipase family protein [Paracoccus versutus]MDF3903644.1 patatin-like phospholipase family protein [Paracoccus sp. AS002]
MAVKRINLALQGGGAHGAFAWGVLDRLLDESDIEIRGISGTSAGALNGAALAAGLSCGPGRRGREAARQNLAHIWSQVGQVSDNSVVRWLHSMFPVPRAWQRLTELFSPVAWLGSLTRVFSPYDSGPFYTNPLAAILREMPHPRLGREEGPVLFVTATNVRTGLVRIFGGAEVTVDTVLASACLPELFRAVEIDDPLTGRREAYWDGGYSGNPALFPLYRPDLPRDIVIVNINPMLREAIPKTPAAIQDRVNEISFNAALLAELRAINFVKRLHAEERLTGRPMKNVLLHAIMDEDLMNSLSARTKLLPNPGLLQRMHDAGVEAAERFLEKDAGNIGERDSYDLSQLFGRR